MCPSVYPYQSSRSVTRSYYRGAAGAILVYDITKFVSSSDCSWLEALTELSTSRESFINLSRWLADARALASPHLVAVLVGNKSDREEEREVEWAEASRWAAENGRCQSLTLACMLTLAISRCSLFGGFLVDGGKRGSPFPTCSPVHSAVHRVWHARSRESR